MADNSKGYNLSFFFDTADSVSEAKKASQAMAGLDRQIKHLERSEKQFEKAQAEINRRFKEGNITGRQHKVLMQQLGTAYKKQTGDSSKLTRSLRKQREEQDRLNRSKERGNRLGSMVGSGLASRAGALGALGAGGVAAGLGLGAVAGFGAYTKQQYERQRLLEREAEFLGLSAKGLEGVSHALSKLGVVSKEEAIDGLKDIRERIGEIASDAEGSLGKAARSIGLDAQRLKGMDVGGQINEIVSALSKLDTETRAFRSRELLGDQAANLLTGAAGNRAEFERLRAQGERNAALLSTKQMESMQKFGETVDDLKASVAQGLLPAVKMFADAAGVFAKNEEDLNSINSKRDYINKLEQEALGKGMRLPKAPDGLAFGYDQSLDESALGNLTGGNTLRSRADKNNRFLGRGGIEKMDAWYNSYYGDGSANRNYSGELTSRINVLEALLGKGANEGSSSTASSGSSSPASTPAAPASNPMDFYVQQEKARRDALERQGWLDTYRKQQPNRSDAQLNRMADMEMQFAKERDGVNVGSKLKELREAQRKYFFNELKRIETLEKAAKIEKDRIKSLREEESAAKAAFDANIKKAEAERQAAFGKLDAQDNKISGDADLLRLRANGASQGGASFSGGSVEEFQYVSEMDKQNEVKDALFAIDKMEQERHERVQKKREEIQQDTQEQMETLRGDLTDLLSQIREKIAISGTN